MNINEHINYSAPMPPGPSACAQRLWEETRRGRKIFNSSNSSFIGGGTDNLIGDPNINAWQCHGVIGGGERNCIQGVNNNPYEASYSFIGGGIENVIHSECSSIIGGSGNTIPVNMANSHIIGSGLTAVAPNTLHANCLNAVNTPVYTGIPYPLGTVIRHALPAPALGLPAGTTILIIQ